jgi:hypothetical protein
MVLPVISTYSLYEGPWSYLSYFPLFQRALTIEAGTVTKGLPPLLLQLSPLGGAPPLPNL